MALRFNFTIERGLRWFAFIAAACTAVGSAVAMAEEPAATPAVRALAPPPASILTRFQDWWNLPEELRTRSYPYRLELQIHYSDPVWRVLIASDGFVDSWVHHATESPVLRSGQRVRIEGDVIPAEGLRLDRAKITVLAENEFATPLSTAGEFAKFEKFNCRRVRTEGFVYRQTELDPSHVQLDMIVEGQPVIGQLMIENNRPIPQVQGAMVRVVGTYSGAADPASKAPRYELWMPNEQSIQVIGWLSRDARFNRPATAVEMLQKVPARQMVVVRGVVHTQVDGKELVLRDGTGQVTVRTPQSQPLERGAKVEAIGVVEMHGGQPELREALFRRATQDGVMAAQPPGLPQLRLADQVRELTRIDAQAAYPVRLQGVVTWSHPQSRTFYMFDASGGLAVKLAPNVPVPPVGTRVDARGHSEASDFAPRVEAEALTLGDRVVLPDAAAVTLEHAMTGVEDGQLVTMSGFVRSIAQDGPWSALELTTAAGEFRALLPPGTRCEAFVGAIVKVKGVCSARTDAQRQLTGVQVWVADPADISVEESAPQDPFAVPERTIGSLRQFSTLNGLNHRVRVSGTVLFHAPGAALTLADDRRSVTVLSRDLTPLKPGDRVEAVGLPGRERNRVVLREAVYRRLGSAAEPVPLAVTDPTLIEPALDGLLVQVRATLLAVNRTQDGVRLICHSGASLFEAPLRASGETGSSDWRPGSVLSLTGVYHLQQDDYGRPRGLELQLRSRRDVAVLQAASWFTLQRAVLIAGSLVLIVALGLVWVMALRHRVRRQTDQLRVQLEKEAHLEAELERSSKLESLGVLAGGIAHDFNNLLTVVLGNLSLARMGVADPADRQRFLQESERAAVRARDLTQQLLTFSRGGAPVRAAVNLTDVVREAAAFALHGSAVKSEFNFGPDLWPADADRAQVAQVVHNLVINATQAMSTGGIVRIDLDNVELAADEQPMLPAGRYLRMTVRDEGAGIPPEHLSRIFDPYFSTKERGQGLGLATVYSIVKKHSGHVEVASEVGRGSTFTIWLPASAEKAPEPVAPALTTDRWRGRVLVMDDEQPIRDFLAVALTKLGCEVTAVADGAAAVAAYQRAISAGAPFELVILDLTIPAGMSGAEAMQRLRILDPAVRAVVSSGYSKDPVMARYREFGFAGAVPKPYVVEDLVAAINEVMFTTAGADAVRR